MGLLAIAGAVPGWLAWLAVRDRWLTPRELLLALVIAALGYVAEVGHTVFKRW